MGGSIGGDELAGMADQFGALTRAELHTAVEEAAFRRGSEIDADAVERALDAALEDLRLVAVARDDEPDLLAPGPAALPTLPEGAEDLPYVLDVPTRELDRETLVEAAERELRAAAASAAADGDAERIRTLLDATYGLEAWAPETDAGEVRDRLDAALAAADEDGDRQAQ